MEYTTIDQRLAIKYNLNLQESYLMGFLVEKLNSNKFINISKSEIVNELPLLSDKYDTIYRYLKKLMNVGLIEFKNNDSNYLKLSINIY